MESVIINEKIEDKIYLIRGQKVMLDFDLAQLYKIPTKVLNQAIKRNIDRFPEDFMFCLTNEETEALKNQFIKIGLIKENLKSQFVTSSWGGRRKPIYAFSEHGILMLSSVLKNKLAVQINIQIMRIFVKLHQFVSNYKELARKLNELERKVSNHDSEIKGVFEIIRKLMVPKEEPKRKIGFVVERKEEK